MTANTKVTLITFGFFGVIAFGAIEPKILLALMMALFLGFVVVGFWFIVRDMFDD